MAVPTFDPTLDSFRRNFHRPPLAATVCTDAVNGPYVMQLFQSVREGSVSLNSFFWCLSGQAAKIGPGTMELIRLLEPHIRHIPVEKSEEAVLVAIEQVNRMPSWSLERPDIAQESGEVATPAAPTAPVAQPVRVPGTAPGAVSKRKVVVKHVFGLFRPDPVLAPTPSGLLPEVRGVIRARHH